MVKFRIINGKRVPLPGSDYRPPSDPRKSQKESSSPYDDEYNRRLQDEFIKHKIRDLEKPKKVISKEKSQIKFERALKLNLGHAKAFLIKATPVLIQLDPDLAAIYTGYKVGKYGYCFMKKVNENYKTSENFEESLKIVIKRDVENKIISKVKSIPKVKASQYAANRIWLYAKENFSEKEMDPKWDEFGENALAKTIEEVGGQFL